MIIVVTFGEWCIRCPKGHRKYFILRVEKTDHKKGVGGYSSVVKHALCMHDVPG